MTNRKALQDKIARNNEAIVSLTRGMLEAIQVLTEDSAKANTTLKLMSDTAEAAALSAEMMAGLDTGLASGVHEVDQYWNKEIGLCRVTKKEEEAEFPRGIY